MSLGLVAAPGEGSGLVSQETARRHLEKKSKLELRNFTYYVRSIFDFKGAFAEHANENTAFHACRVGDEVNGHPGTRIMQLHTFGWFQRVGTLYLTRKQAKLENKKSGEKYISSSKDGDLG